MSNTLKNNVSIIIIIVIVLVSWLEIQHLNNENIKLLEKTKEVKRYNDNLIRVQSQLKRKLKASENLKPIIKTKIKTKIKVVVKSNTRMLEIATNSSGEDKFLKWWFKNDKFTYKLKPIKIDIYETKNGFVISTEKGLFIDSHIKTLPKRENAIWVKLESNTGISGILTKKSFIFTLGYNIISRKIIFGVGFKLFSF